MTDAYDRDFQVHPRRPGPPTTQRPNSGLAVVSLIFGILGFSRSPGSARSSRSSDRDGRGLGQIREEGGRVGGRSMAKVGMTLGLIQLAIIPCHRGLMVISYLRGRHPRRCRPRSAPPGP